MEDNALSFQKLKHIIQGTVAEVYMDKFNLHSDFHAACTKIYNNSFGARAKDTFKSNLENSIQHFWCNGPQPMYVKLHKATH